MTTHGSTALSNARHNLQKLSIDPYSYKSHLQISPRTPDSDEVPTGHQYHRHNHSGYSSYEQAIVSDSDIDDMGESVHYPSTRARDSYSSQAIDEADQPAPILCSVLCQHDFESDDPDHLPFRKNEILDVIKMEETGWWAAMRVEIDPSTGARRDVVGWIPEAYVKALPEGEADRLRTLRPEVRGYDYAAEEMYRQAPVQSSPNLWDAAHARYSSEASAIPGTPLPVYTRTDPRLTRAVSQMHLSRTLPASSSNDHNNSYFRSRPRRIDKPDRPPGQSSSLAASSQLSGQHSRHHERPPTHTISSSLSDIERPPSRGRAETIPNTYVRSGSSGSIRMPGTNLTNNYRDTDAASRAIAKTTSSRVTSSHSLTRREGSSSGSEAVMQQRHPPTRANSSRLPGTGARSFGGKPKYFDQIVLDSEGRVRVASLDALVEKLIADCSNHERKEMAEETMFRRVFLTTFRTFMTAEKLFEMLFGIFYSRTMDDSDDEEWKRQQLESRRGVLTILLTWVEDYRFLEEDVLLAHRLKEFLDLVKPPLESLARKINRRVDKITFQINNEPSPVTSPVKIRKFMKMPRMDSSKVDASDVADQLTLLEFSKYRKVTPQECFRHTTHPKEAWPNLNSFCGTHEKIVHWVKSSILEIDSLKHRGDMIEHWIKVAERCKTLGNFATMSAVITSLSSTVISQLSLSWNRVSMHRRPQYDSLLRLIDPTGNFSILRGLLRNHDGPCIPFVLPYLTDLAHINDTYTDEPSDGQGSVQVCFVKRQKWYDVVHTMLKYQSRPYEALSKVDTAVEFVERHLKEVDEGAKDRDEKYFWNRSRELQAHESHQHDLLKGLEAAGF